MKKEKTRIDWVRQSSLLLGTIAGEFESTKPFQDLTSAQVSIWNQKLPPCC